LGVSDDRIITDGRQKIVVPLVCAAYQKQI
jgi:hypothetical protein